MAKHFHLVLDFDDGEIIGIALPRDAGTSTGSGSDERTGQLIGTVDGDNRIFEFPSNVIYDPVNNIVPKLYHGGRRLYWSADLCDTHYVVYESVPSSGNYDRVRLTRFAPTQNVPYADYLEA